MNFSVTQFGVQLDKSKYTWCEKTKTFSTTERNLVLDFSNINGVTFKTGSICTFTTGHHCTFKTGSNCTFYTWSNCTFNTGSDCTFYTWSNCTFNTGEICTFKTGFNCTFTTGFNCTFDTGEDCVVIRRDIFEVIKLESNKKIKLNDYGRKGFVYIYDKKKITIDSKEIEISLESFNELKKQLLDD